MRAMARAGTLHVNVRDDAVRHLSARTSVDLRGLPGSGRSTLAQAVADELDDAGWHVVRVAGVLPLRERPLEALAAAGLVARQAPPQGPTTALSGAVQGVVAAVKGASTVLFVDDVDDLDDASVGAIAAAYTQARFPILSTSRLSPRSSRTSLAAVVQPALTLQVGPLGFVDIQTLLVEYLGGPMASAAVSLAFAESGGLAGLALALTQCARDHGTLREVDGVWQTGDVWWSREFEGALEPLLHRLSAPATDGLKALALAGTVELATARQFMPWEVLEELDGYGLLRFVPRDEEMLVGVFPLAIVENFRHQAGAWHLRVDEALTAALGGSVGRRPAFVGAPRPGLGVQEGAARLRPEEDASGADEDVAFNRLLVEHWQRELVVRRREWQRSPAPRTAVALLRAMMVTGPDLEEVRALREATPRTGESRDLVAYDDWCALFLGTAAHSLDEARAVLDTARSDAREWSALIDGVEAFLVLLTDHAPDADALAQQLRSTVTDVREVVGTARTELLLAQGRSAEALAELAALAESTSEFVQARRASRPLALLMEDRVDEALADARDLLATARHEYDVENIVGAAYVLALVLLWRGRIAELRALLGSVLSSGLMPALARSQHVALLSMAADLAVDEGSTTTARTLAQQALALQTGPGPYALGSPTEAVARLDATGMPPAKAQELIAARLWSETTTLIERGYLVSGYICGMLAIAYEPTPERGAALLEVGAKIPAPLFRHHDMFAAALTEGDPDRLARTADHMADAGVVSFATQAYSAASIAYRTAGASARAVEVLEAARRRLERWGPEAAAGLSSAAEVAELTAREREIARLVVTGLSNQEIARRLTVSVSTVENHLHRTFRKLGVGSRAELARVYPG